MDSTKPRRSGVPLTFAGAFAIAYQKEFEMNKKGYHSLFPHPHREVGSQRFSKGED